MSQGLGHGESMVRSSRRYWQFAWVATAIFVAGRAEAYTANKVFFEFLRDGRYRVTVNYTVPALKEFRESVIEFDQKKAAEKFYWTLVRGGDFFPPDVAKSRYEPPKSKPSPW